MGPVHRASDERPAEQVISEKAGNIWFISVPDVPEALASTRRHDQIEGIARGNIARALGIPATSFEVVISSPRHLSGQSVKSETGNAEETRRPRPDYSGPGPSRSLADRRAWRDAHPRGPSGDPVCRATSLADAKGDPKSSNRRFWGPSSLLPGHREPQSCSAMDSPALSARIFDELAAALPNDGNCLIRRVHASKGWADIHFVTVNTAIARGDAAPDLERTIRSEVGKVISNQRFVVIMEWGPDSH